MKRQGEYEITYEYMSVCVFIVTHSGEDSGVRVDISSWVGTVKKENDVLQSMMVTPSNPGLLFLYSSTSIKMPLSPKGLRG